MVSLVHSRQYQDVKNEVRQLIFDQSPRLQELVVSCCSGGGHIGRESSKGDEEQQLGRLEWTLCKRAHGRTRPPYLGGVAGGGVAGGGEAGGGAACSRVCSRWWSSRWWSSRWWSSQQKVEHHMIEQPADG